MNQEEGVMIEYLSKISELILQMRYDPHYFATSSNFAATQTNINNANNNTMSPQKTLAARSSTQKFGFVLPKQQYKMGNIITEKWNSSFTALTVEFFLQKKSDGTNYCIEQWQFCYEKEFALPQNSSKGNDRNNKNSIAPSNRKNKKLSNDMKLTILSRSITSLLVNTPLWQLYISSENRSIKNSYILDYKISFAKNKPLPNATPIQLTELNLSSGSLIFNCFYRKDLDQLLINSINSTVTQNLQNCNNNCGACGICCSNNYNSSNCRNNSNISNNINSVSTSNSTPNGNNTINNNYYVPNFKNKNNRERFLSEKIDAKYLISNQVSNNNIQNTSTSTKMISENQGGSQQKHSLTQEQNNMTFRFSFSDNEPLSDEEKKIIKHHLRQSSVVSVYSRKDDITIISTPEEIAIKIRDGEENEFNGLEIEMVFEEDKVSKSTQSSCNLNNWNNEKESKQENNQYQKADNKKRNDLDNKKGGVDNKYIVNQNTPHKNEKEMPAQIIIDDDFDFQLIEEENDRPIDLAIKKLSELINQHKIQLREQTASQSAFELYQSLTKYVENY